MSRSIPSFDALPDNAYIRQAQLIPAPVPFSPATLWRKVKSGEFPQPVKRSKRITAWRVEDVRAWLAARSA
jgi:prophage regulatory protein